MAISAGKHCHHGILETGSEKHGRPAIGRHSEAHQLGQGCGNAREYPIVNQNTQRLRQHRSVAANAAKFMQGVPVFGQYVDEAIGALHGDQAMQNTRSAQEAMEREHPFRSTRLKPGGGIAGSVPAVLAGGPALLFWLPRSMGGKMLAGAATGAGAIEGAVSGAGRGNDGDRMATAVEDAKTGAKFGGTIGAAAPVVSAGVKALVNWARTTDAGTIAKALGISKDAAEAMKPDFAALDFDAAARSLEIVGPKAI